MLAALDRYPHHLRTAIARKWAMRSNAAQAAARLTREADPHTQRMRALHDMRGQIIREGVTYRAAGVTHWHIRRAVKGRINQVEAIADGRILRTCSLKTAITTFLP
jgi:hypothetical protein